MAGTPERRKDQPQSLTLTTEAKDRIGNFYLSKLLKKSNYRRLDSSSLFISAESWIHERAGARISSDLADSLNLKSLRWIATTYEYSLPKLILGKDLCMDDQPNNDFNEALAAIEIARSSDVVQKGFLPIEKYTPLYLRIAGIDKKQNRIVAATWDLTEGNRLTRLSCSITPGESFSLRSSVEKECTKLECKSIYDKIVNKTPTDINNPYETPGLITKAMCEKLGYSPEMLTINFNHGLYYYGKTQHNDPRIPLGYYYSHFEEGVCAFGLGKTAEKKGHAPWEIRVPKVLQEA